MELMQDKEFDRLIREKMDGLNPVVPDSIWNKIEAGLDEEKPLSLISPKRERGYFRWIGTAAALVLLGFAWWMMDRPAQVIYLKGNKKGGALTQIPAHNRLQAAGELPSPVAIKTKSDKRTPVKKMFMQHETQAATAFHAEEQNTPAEANKVIMLTEDTELPHAALYQELPKVALQTAVAISDKPAMKNHLENVPLLFAAITVADDENSFNGSRQPVRQSFGVASLLNFVVGAVDNRERKIISFTEDSEGILLIDFSKSFASRKKNGVYKADSDTKN